MRRRPPPTSGGGGSKAPAPAEEPSSSEDDDGLSSQDRALIGEIVKVTKGPGTGSMGFVTSRNADGSFIIKVSSCAPKMARIRLFLMFWLTSPLEHLLVRRPLNPLPRVNEFF